MKKMSGILVFLITSVCAKASPAGIDLKQLSPICRDTIPERDPIEEKIFERVEIEASFPGGDEAWRKYLEQNLNAAVPAEYGAPAGTYTVIVQFVVDKDGKITDIKALTNHGYGMESEVIRFLKKAPKWNPAIQDGRKVKAYRKQPVTFQVIDDRKKRKRN
ncbi:MAG: energy transducer TonB [Chitinophagaceae bacterium]